MQIKQAIILLTIGLTAITSSGQSIKEYFIPESAYNKVSFYSPGKSGERTEMSRVIYYSIKDGNYDLLDGNMMQGKPVSIITRTVQFTATEVKMIKSISTNIVGETNKKKNYNPSVTLLKMPPERESISWTTTEVSGDKDKCTAVWTTVSVDGVNKKAIKLTSIIIGAENWGKKISYYVKGIGLWKTELSNGSITHTDDAFDGLDYEATTK